MTLEAVVGKACLVANPLLVDALMNSREDAHHLGCVRGREGEGERES